MKGLIGFSLGIILVVVAGIYLSRQDPIGAEVTQANADLTVGSTVVNDLQLGITWILKWAFGATLAGVGAAIFVEVRKNYRRSFLEKNTRRWQPGPNARWQSQQPAQRSQNITNRDLLTMALLAGQQRLQSFSARMGGKQTRRENQPEDELDIQI